MTIRILVFSFLSFTVTPWSQEHFNLEEQTVKFHRFVIAARQHNSYSPQESLTIARDTNMQFELLPSSRTLRFSDNRPVPVKCCGAEKKQASPSH